MYSLDIHKHRFACWCAATAASQVKTFRFRVETGRKLIELGAGQHEPPNESKFLKTIRSIQVFTAQSQFDDWHTTVIENMLGNSHLQGVLDEENKRKQKTKATFILDQSNFTYGIAAKLLNCYLKAFYLESLESGFGRLIHPPIDRLLFQGLVEEDEGREFFVFQKFVDERHLSGYPKLPAWTSLDKIAYIAIVSRIKLYLENSEIESLWQIEEAWKGHQ